MLRSEIVFMVLLAVVIVQPVVLAHNNPPYTTYSSFSDLMAGEDGPYPKLIRVSEPGTRESPNYTGFFFYQCQQFDPTDRYMLGMRVHCQNRDVRPTDRAEIGLIDLQDGYKWIRIGDTTAWNWQQGARLQWRPGSNEVLWNDRSDDSSRYVCRVYDFKTGARRTLPRPVYIPSPDGDVALTHDFERMKHGGTPYVGIEDEYADQYAPKKTGIWRMDLNTGEAALIMSLDQMAGIAYPGGAPSSGCLYFFREGWNPSGSRFIAFVKDPDNKFDKAFSLTANGTDVRYLYDRPSHHEWQDDDSAMSVTFPAPGAIGLSLTRPLDLVSFDGEGLPLNKAGQPYISQYQPAGQATVTLEQTGGVRGGCARFELTQGRFYPQFNAHNADGTRGFAREYVAGTWRWNTYNRLSFWVQVPTSNRPMDRSGRETMQVGTFVKRTEGQDAHSDETGGGHWYHHINLAATGTWTKVVLNMHPHHLRGASGSTEHGDRPHPTNEPQYNCFDTLTRLYIEAIGEPSSYPAVFRLDDFQFYQEVHDEADEQVYSIAATYVPAERRVILTWSRNKNENDVPHEVRYAFESIHLIGWDRATPAPGGMVAPPGFQGYNGMVYMTTDIPLEGKRAVYLAIRPANTARFSQVELPDPRMLSDSAK